MLKFKIPYRLPGLNEYTAANRRSKYAGAGLKSDTQDVIEYCIKQFHTRDEKPLKTPIYVKFTWYEPNQRRDKDNVAFAKKFVLDAMQSAGILQNDNNRCIIGFCDDFVYGQGEGVTVEVIECDKIAGQHGNGSEDVTATLRAEEHGYSPCVLQSAGFCTEPSAKSRGIGFEKETAPTLRAGVVPDKVQTLTSRMGTGGWNCGSCKCRN